MKPKNQNSVASVCGNSEISHQFSVKIQEEKMTRLTIICISCIIVSLIFAGPSYADVDPGTILAHGSSTREQVISLWMPPGMAMTARS